MSCASCVGSIEKTVGALPGVTLVNVALLAEKLDVRYDDGMVDAQAIADAVSSAGYGCSVVSVQSQKQGEEAVSDEPSPEDEAKQMRVRSCGWWVTVSGDGVTVGRLGSQSVVVVTVGRLGRPNGCCDDGSVRSRRQGPWRPSFLCLGVAVVAAVLVR